MTNSRLFRKPESLLAERITRDAIAPFLRDRGFTVFEDIRHKTGTAESQALMVRSPDGATMKLHARLCWRRDGRKAREQLYSAAQLRARLIEGDWLKTLRFVESRGEAEGYTHTLLVQRDGREIVSAALLPLDALTKVWIRQRDVSTDLARRGLLGRSRKNHAMNGSSPTIWLKDDRTPEAHAVADALWSWPGVHDLVKLPVVHGVSEADDTFDDCPGADYARLGSDGGLRRSVLRSGVKRDPRVRAAVLERAANQCERRDCHESRAYSGFLDVHHILGAEKSDRFWNCVALCPNCHREAHVAPDADGLNAALLEVASVFAPSVGPTVAALK